MVGFSGVLAAPFFFLALFPGLIKKMPKSGGWMNNLKVVFGFVIIGAAMKFLSNVDVA
jgi:thiol:disulfide interchange protein DsbD